MHFKFILSWHTTHHLCLTWIFLYSHVVRKSIARVLIVMNQKQKENLRKLYKVFAIIFLCWTWLILRFYYRTRSTSPWICAPRRLVLCAVLLTPMRPTSRLQNSWGRTGPSLCASLLSRHKGLCGFCCTSEHYTQVWPPTSYCTQLWHIETCHYYLTLNGPSLMWSCLS